MSGPWLIALLVAAVAFIVLATARIKLHPFLALLAASYALGLASGLGASGTLEAITAGFGATIGHIGIVIAAGTVIGVILERSGGAAVMAGAAIRVVGEARSALAMSVTGAVVSVPVFCDSGFVILSSLARSLARQANQPFARYAVALALGLYTTHVFVPPTPGPIAAAGTLGADVGLVMLLGLVVSVPVVAATYVFASVVGPRHVLAPPAAGVDGDGDVDGDVGSPPSAAMAFAPIVVPLVLISLRSFAALPGAPLGDGALAAALAFAGNPNTALLVGVLVAFASVRRRGPHVYGDWVGAGLGAAGGIILITGAGGALGRVLQDTQIGEYLGAALASSDLGIFVPFLVAAGLKTAQGSSTVAIITTASLVAPLLGVVGLDSGAGPALATLAIGAGAMTVSHANDSFFWVVSQCSGMKVEQAYALHTAGTAVAGLTGLGAVWVLALVLG